MCARVLKCQYCLDKVTDPFISCSECKSVYLCAKCFACGVEGGKHKKTHKYTIEHVSNNGECHLFVDSPLWQAEEELKLLDALETYGYGNWNEVAVQLQTRSPSECRDHYEKFYINGALGGHTNVDHSFPVIKEHIYHPDQQIYCDCGPNICDLRLDHQRLLGYLPNRDEFEYEYMNDGEDILNVIPCTQNGDDLEKAFQLALVEIYNGYVEDRYFRHYVARTHNLVSHLMRDLIQNQTKYNIHNARINKTNNNIQTISSAYKSGRKYIKKCKLSQFNCPNIKQVNNKSCNNNNDNNGVNNNHHHVNNGDDLEQSVSDSKEQIDHEVYISTSSITPKIISRSLESLLLPSADPLFPNDAGRLIKHNNKHSDYTSTSNNSWLNSINISSSYPEIIDSGISSGESSSNSLMDEINLNLKKFHETVANNSVTVSGNSSTSNDNQTCLLSYQTNNKFRIRPRSNSDSVCDSNSLRLLKNRFYEQPQNHLNCDTINPNFDTSKSLHNLNWFTQNNIETPLSVPVKRRRGRPPKNASKIMSFIKSGPPAAHRNSNKSREQKLFITHPEWLKPFFRYLSRSEAEIFLKNLDREQFLRTEVNNLYKIKGLDLPQIKNLNFEAANDENDKMKVSKSPSSTSISSSVTANSSESKSVCNLSQSTPSSPTTTDRRHFSDSHYVSNKLDQKPISNHLSEKIKPLGTISNHSTTTARNSKSSRKNYHRNMKRKYRNKTSGKYVKHSNKRLRIAN